MVLLKTYILKSHTKGITLIEVIIVIALLTILAQISLSGDISFYRKKTFNEEVDNLYLSFMRTRVTSMHNVCYGISCTDGKPHGVHIEADRYVLFQGNLFSHRDVAYDEIVFFPPSVSATSLGDVVFEQLSGNTNAGTITITDGESRVAQILVNTEGRIEKQ